MPALGGSLDREDQFRISQTDPGGSRHAPVRNDGLWQAAAGDRAHSGSEGSRRACGRRVAGRPHSALQNRTFAHPPKTGRWLPCDVSTPLDARLFRPAGLSLAGSSRLWARPPNPAAGAGSHTRSRPGSPRGAVGGRTRKPCIHCPVSPDRWGQQPQSGGTSPVRPRSPGASGGAAQPIARPR